MTSAHQLGRRAVAWPCEVHGGITHRLARSDPAARRVASRIARVLQPSAESAGAWVSTEALIRVQRDPDTALRPAVAVVAGPLPYDGVVDAGVIALVELDVARLATWRAAGVGPVWVPQGRGVVVADATTTVVAQPDGELTLVGRSRVVLAAADLCRVVALSG